METNSDSKHEIINDNVDVGVRFFLSREDEGFKSLHWHSHIEIVLVLDGEVTFHFDNKDIMLRENEFVVVGSGVLHSTSNLSNTSLVLQIPLGFLERYWAGSEFLQFYLPTSERDKWSYDYQTISSLLKDMTQVYAAKEPGYLLLFNSKLLEALYMLITKYSVSVASPGTGENDQIKKILGYIHNHYSEPLSVKAIAENFHYHPDYLSRKFKSHSGVSITRYIAQLRIEHIHSDIINTNDSVEELFKKYGQRNKRLGIQIFKQLYGASPTEIRRRGSQ